MSSLLLAHLGIYVAISIEAVIICILFVRISKLERILRHGDLTLSIIGYEIPNFQAVNSRSGQIEWFTKLNESSIYLLIVSGDCFMCQKLLHELQRVKFSDFLVYDQSKFVVYCQGVERGCDKLMSGLDSSVITLIGHYQELSNIIPNSTTPALLEVDVSGRVIRHSYPLSAHDVLDSMQNKNLEGKSKEFKKIV
ncbi:MAG: hypothetical protein F4039_08430 [Gammaproteobacteria bacterium]|nr:hypothetical protein [Gammaproteobacteria bacterium]MXX94906.1 hypothetical protein [Gammaproteobacteria bacterium]MYF53370.1 hypothetical protein [Gammaproteobacteria bacterium]MYK44098.1 hypothetical protein [Gammaproteobacteria bacterium]